MAKTIQKPRTRPVKITAAREQGVPDKFEDLSIEQLSDIIERAEVIKARKIDTARRAFLDETRSRARLLGVDLDGAFRTAQREGGPGPKRGGTPQPKYRFPNGSTWSGRGRPPRQLQALEAEGHNRDEYLIKSAAE